MNLLLTFIDLTRLPESDLVHFVHNSLPLNVEWTSAKMSCQRHKPTHKLRKSDPYKRSDTESDKSLEPKKMHLLFLIWEDDDLDLSVEVDNLKAAFDNGFACTTTETFTIPSSKYAGGMLKGLLEAWMADHDDGESLLVVYYGGHGGTDESGYLTWSAQ